MLDRMRQALIALTARAQKSEEAETFRKLRGHAATLLRDPSGIRGKLESLQEIVDLHHAETSTWVSPEEFASGGTGPFDACDLRIWLALSEAAGVPAVPAREVLRLSEAEMSVASGSVAIPDDLVTKGIRRRAAALREQGFLPGVDEITDEEETVDVEMMKERIISAMDDIPEGWMVRSSRCGSAELKTLAGAGVAGPTPPEVRFGPGLEVGPGWIRVGNRRRVNVSDARTVAIHAQGPGGDAVFLARPWVESARYVAGSDPHRHGTPFAGKGIWPAEWRAFVEKGRVVGVSWYYGWCGEATQENAAIALEVRDLAQRIADQAVALRMHPRLMEVEMMRNNRHPSVTGNEAVQRHLATFGREDVACTLDFIEAKDGGLMLLEGGPANTPFGGGHPCAFAGCGGRPVMGNKTVTEGVAFRLMPHVIMADLSTWEDGEREGCVLSWDEVAEMADKPRAPSC